MTLQTINPDYLPNSGAATRGREGATTGVNPGPGTGFARLVAQQTPAGSSTALDTVRVKRGDTLIGIIKDAAHASGRTITGAEAWRLAQTVAAHNGLRDVNLIYPDQTLQLKGIQAQLGALPSAAVAKSAPPQSVVRVPPPPSAPMPPASTQAALALRMAQGLSAQSLDRVQAKTPTGALPTPAALTALRGAPFAPRMHTPVLDKTLQRAVDKGFIASQEVNQVKAKIAHMAQKYNFQPDDFARLTLMESDGMNPQASNGSCHGIIQFCDGDDRGAASVGFAKNPKAILGLSAVAQLDLVDKYFSDVGVGKNGRERLDDLYLSVLTPNARNERRRHVPLDIPGQQAAYLHVGRDRTRPITRQSIWTGLVQNANERLRAANQTTTSPKAIQSWKVSAYEGRS
jgi:hypothetical protein